MSKRNVFLMIVLLLTATVLYACGSDNEASNEEQSFKIRAALSLEETNPLMLSFPIFKEIVEKESEGRIEIEYVGGPESIPPFNQAEAVQNGTIDMGWIAGSYYADIVPEVLGISFSELDYEEELERGSIEYLSQFHEDKMNVKVIGRAGNGDLALHIADGIEVKSSDDLKGLSLRGTSVYVPTIEAIGSDAIALEAGEIYSSLEKGLIEGYGWMNFSLPELGAQELTGYQIEPYIGKADQMILANLDFWSKLPEDLQKIVMESAEEAFYESRDKLDDILENERNEMMEVGVEYIELEDAKEFKEKISEHKWEWAAERVDNIDELKEYFQ